MSRGLTTTKTSVTSLEISFKQSTNLFSLNFKLYKVEKYSGYGIVLCNLFLDNNAKCMLYNFATLIVIDF